MGRWRISAQRRIARSRRQQRSAMTRFPWAVRKLKGVPADPERRASTLPGGERGWGAGWAVPHERICRPMPARSLAVEFSRGGIPPLPLPVGRGMPPGHIGQAGSHRDRRRRAVRRSRTKFLGEGPAPHEPLRRAGRGDSLRSLLVAPRRLARVARRRGQRVRLGGLLPIGLFSFCWRISETVTVALNRAPTLLTKSSRPEIEP